VSGALVIADPLLANQVQQVLQHPVAQQRPDLMHFSPPDGPSQDATQDAAGATLFGGGKLLAAPMLVTGSLAAVLLVIAAWLWVTASSPSRSRLAAILGAAAIAPVIGASATTTVSPLHHAHRSAPVVAQFVSALNDQRRPDNALRARALEPTMRNQTWTTLLGIEQAIDQDRRQLAAAENAIASYNALLSSTPASTATAVQTGASAGTAGMAPPAGSPSAAATTAAPASTPATPPTPELLKPNVVTLVANHLNTLVTQHATLVTQYQTDLQREYDFYVAAAQSPSQQADLVQAASLTAPSAANAVAYDIATVSTQLAQEAAIQAAEAAAAATPPPTLQGSFVPSKRVTFHAPVSGIVTQGFGPTDFSLEPPVTYNGVFYAHFHTGLDIANALGTPVGAAAAGRVILATSSVDAQGHLTGYGNYVVIDHGNGFVTLYGHLDKLLVTAGQVVKQGQVIGLMGSTGWSTGPHLHFEIRKNDVFVDPAPYLKAQLQPTG
jgi:murein DD-endopeptidase MepM/ murein hydrolase activator NlpD